MQGEGTDERVLHRALRCALWLRAVRSPSDFFTDREYDVSNGEVRERSSDIGHCELVTQGDELLRCTRRSWATWCRSLRHRWRKSKVILHSRQIVSSYWGCHDGMACTTGSLLAHGDAVMDAVFLLCFPTFLPRVRAGGMRECRVRSLLCVRCLTCAPREVPVLSRSTQCAHLRAIQDRMLRNMIFVPRRPEDSAESHMTRWARLLL